MAPQPRCRRRLGVPSLLVVRHAAAGVDGSTWSRRGYVSRIPSHVLAVLHASLALCSNQMSALQDDNDSVLFSTLVTDSVVAFLGGPQASHVPPPVWVISELVSQNWRASDPSTRGCRYARMWRQWRSSVLSPNARSLPIIFQRGSSTLAVGAHSVVMH